MSITRLQQARQMYAMGQRVAKTLDGSRPGYRGSDMGTVSTSTREATNTQGNMNTSGADYGGGNQGGDSSGPDRSRVSDTQQYNHYEAMNQYNPMKEDMLPGDVPDGFIKPEDAVNLGLNLRPYEQKRVDLLNTPYQPKKMPFIPFISTPVNLFNETFGKIGYDRNLNFFANNVAGKYGYNMTIDDFKKYMRDRGSGKVGAYGNENMGQNAINARAAQGDSTQGIMDVAVDDTTDDTTTDDELILRFLGADSTLDPAAAGLASTDELRAMLLERAKNLYT